MTTPELHAKTAKRIGRVKSRLILEHTFFGSLICGMDVQVTDSVPTAATDGERILFNPTFVDTLSDDELIFLAAHEVYHCVYQHMYRRNGRDPEVWNYAIDYVVNDALILDKIGIMPKGGLLDPALVAQGNGLADTIYDILMARKQDKGGGGPGIGVGPRGQPGAPLDDCQDAKGTEAEQASAEAMMRVKVAMAANAAKMCGELSAGVARIIEQAAKPRVDWRRVMREFITARAKVERTFARPKRRFIADDLYLPSLGGQKMGKLLLAVDVSGSIGARELAEFGAEAGAIKADVNPESVEVVYFDSQVCHHDTFTEDEDLDLAPHGGGGTRFSPIFAFAASNDIEPAACVVLTDLECNDFGPAPDYPVLWVTTGRTRAPWGRVVEMHRAQ